MKKEYTQIYRGDFGTPSLKVVEVDGEKPGYFYGEKEISQNEFNEIYAKIKSAHEHYESRKIVVFGDDGNEIANVSTLDNDIRSSVDAKIKLDDKDFEYKQIKQKSGRLQVNGRLASSYMLIRIGEQKSEYTDRQPSLDDKLLDVRDEMLKPYFDVMAGSCTISNMPVNAIQRQGQPGDN